MLSASETDLLMDVARRRAPDQLSVVEELGIRHVTLAEREALRRLLALELLDSGLDCDDEPNEFGLRLEEIIDKLGAA